MVVVREQKLKKKKKKKMQVTFIFLSCHSKGQNPHGSPLSAACSQHGSVRAHFLARDVFLPTDEVRGLLFASAAQMLRSHRWITRTTQPELSKLAVPSSCELAAGILRDSAPLLPKSIQKAEELGTVWKQPAVSPPHRQVLPWSAGAGPHQVQGVMNTL